MFEHTVARFGRAGGVQASPPGVVPSSQRRLCAGFAEPSSQRRLCAGFLARASLRSLLNARGVAALASPRRQCRCSNPAVASHATDAAWHVFCIVICLLRFVVPWVELICQSLFQLCCFITIVIRIVIMILSSTIIWSVLWLPYDFINNICNMIWMRL